MHRRIAVRGIVVHEGKLLCCKLKDTLSGQPLDFWCTPGGGLDEGEALIPGLKREMLEETGIEASVGDLLFIQQFAQGDNEHIEFFFHIDNPADFTQIDLSKTTHGQAEIAEFAFIDPAENNVLPSFLKAEDFTVQSSGSAPKILNYLDKECL